MNLLYLHWDKLVKNINVYLTWQFGVGLFTAFISVVILRYRRQHSEANLEVAAEAEREDSAEKQPQKALVVSEKVSCD